MALPVPLTLLQVQYVQQGENVYKVLVPQQVGNSEGESVVPNATEPTSNPIICQVQGIGEFQEQSNVSNTEKPHLTSFIDLSSQFQTVKSLVKLKVQPDAQGNTVVIPDCTRKKAQQSGQVTNTKSDAMIQIPTSKAQISREISVWATAPHQQVSANPEECKSLSSSGSSSVKGQSIRGSQNIVHIRQTSIIKPNFNEVPGTSVKNINPIISTVSVSTTASSLNTVVKTAAANNTSNSVCSVNTKSSPVILEQEHRSIMAKSRCIMPKNSTVSRLKKVLTNSANPASTSFVNMSNKSQDSGQFNNTAPSKASNYNNLSGKLFSIMKVNIMKGNDTLNTKRAPTIIKILHPEAKELENAQKEPTIVTLKTSPTKTSGSVTNSAAVNNKTSQFISVTGEICSPSKGDIQSSISQKTNTKIVATTSVSTNVQSAYPVSSCSSLKTEASLITSSGKPRSGKSSSSIPCLLVTNSKSGQILLSNSATNISSGKVKNDLIDLPLLTVSTPTSTLVSAVNSSNPLSSLATNTKLLITPHNKYLLCNKQNSKNVHILSGDITKGKDINTLYSIAKLPADTKTTLKSILGASVLPASGKSVDTSKYNETEYLVEVSDSSPADRELQSSLSSPPLLALSSSQLSATSSSQLSATSSSQLSAPSSSSQLLASSPSLQRPASLSSHAQQIKINIPTALSFQNLPRSLPMTTSPEHKNYSSAGSVKFSSLSNKNLQGQSSYATMERKVSIIRKVVKRPIPCFTKNVLESELKSEVAKVAPVVVQHRRKACKTADTIGVTDTSSKVINPPACKSKPRKRKVKKRGKKKNALPKQLLSPPTPKLSDDSANEMKPVKWSAESDSSESDYEFELQGKKQRSVVRHVYYSECEMSQSSSSDVDSHECKIIELQMEFERKRTKHTKKKYGYNDRSLLTDKSLVSSELKAIQQEIKHHKKRINILNKCKYLQKMTNLIKPCKVKVCKLELKDLPSKSLFSFEFKDAIEDLSTSSEFPFHMVAIKIEG